MAQGPAAGVVYALKAGLASARLHTGDERVSVPRVVDRGIPGVSTYHVLREVILYKSTVDNSGRVGEPRP